MENKDELGGTVKLVFQPDEEGFTGAKAMLEAGVLDAPSPQAGLAFHVHSGTPSGILLCIEHFGIEKEKIILVGDQIFTDCIAAHRAGIECWLVKPIKDKETWFFRLKRRFEKPIIREYNKRRGKRFGKGRKTQE